MYSKFYVYKICRTDAVADYQDLTVFISIKKMCLITNMYYIKLLC